MFNLFKTILSGTSSPAISERERAYLNESVSRIDLERREREVESGKFRQPHPYF